jgi:hypothetical protein
MRATESSSPVFCILKGAGSDLLESFPFSTPGGGVVSDGGRPERMLCIRILELLVRAVSNLFPGRLK